MKFEYMGYGDIYGGLFCNNIFGEKGLSFRMFFENDADYVSKNLDPAINEGKIQKFVPEELENRKKVICVNC